MTTPHSARAWRVRWQSRHVYPAKGEVEEEDEIAGKDSTFQNAENTLAEQVDISVRWLDEVDMRTREPTGAANVVQPASSARTNVLH